MSAADTIVSIRSGAATRRVRLMDFLDADGEERAALQANGWIKSLRRAHVDGVSFRERFTYRRDSLWWFAELYLHKERTVLALFRTMRAAAALFDRESPAAIRVEDATGAAGLILPQMARQRQVQYDGPRSSTIGPGRRTMDARSTMLMLAAIVSPRRPLRAPAPPQTTVAAFVHKAFWRGDASDGSAESYIGPVLQALERALPRTGQTIRYVGVGPSVNFRARRWWRPGTPAADAVEPIEALVPRTRLAGSSGLWAARHAMRRSMEQSNDLRAAAQIEGCDCWPIVSNALAGIALLQFPWSARAIDEADAAFDALSPQVALTYAEAGGWGRALAITARRRGVPLVGLQHGFIYRHWLNYLHEPDEMDPAAPGSTDQGFPLPRTTLVFDEYAARHLMTAGRFPRDAIAVTGSPRLDQLAATFRTLDPGEVAAARESAGAAGPQPLLLLVTKYSEVRTVLPALLDAVRNLPGAHLAIKAHPAETPDLYEKAADGIANVRVLPPSTPLAPLLRASRAVVTVNSTVAIDALALGVPALTIGLPNNLSPFVQAGAMAGAQSGDEIAAALRRLLYDDRFRERLAAAAGALASEYRFATDGGAAERSASAVLGFVRQPGNEE